MYVDGRVGGGRGGAGDKVHGAPGGDRDMDRYIDIDVIYTFIIHAYCIYNDND